MANWFQVRASDGEVTSFLFDPSRLAVVPLGFVPLLGFLIDPAELMPGNRLHGRLAELLEQRQRGLISRQSLVELAFQHGQRAELAQRHALATQVPEILVNLDPASYSFRASA